MNNAKFRNIIYKKDVPIIKFLVEQENLHKSEVNFLCLIQILNKQKNLIIYLQTINTDILRFVTSNYTYPHLFFMFKNEN